MSNITFRPGTFAWREMLTTDVDTSVRFYGELFGWKTESAPMPGGGTYVMLHAGDRTIGGMMEVPMPELPAYWCSYVSVEDVDKTAASVTEHGGKVAAGPFDAGTHGRLAIFVDPQGATIAAWRAANGDGEARAPGLGEFVWDQLNTSDPAAATTFYEKVFGWTKKPFPGSSGGLQLLSAGTTEVAGLMQAPPGAPAHWLAYVAVEDLAAAEARAVRGGGKVFLERLKVGGHGAIGVIADNVGAMLGLFEAKKPA